MPEPAERPDAAGHEQPGEPLHLPVMLERCVDLLAPALASPGALLVDGTVGLGGHTGALLRTRHLARGVGLDRDPQALVGAARHLADVATRLTLVETTFDQVEVALSAVGRDRVDAVLLDLGVSSLQLDSDDRGFSYARDTPLDMRMGREGPTAADLLNTESERELARIFTEYGEERLARKLAAAVVAERRAAPFSTSGQLVALVYRTIPAPARRTGGHPAKRVFQALRVAVNNELGRLAAALPAWLERLVPGGRLVVLSYHSGEDRIVKRALASVTTVELPDRLPVEPPPPPFRLLVRGAERPGAAEIATNPRAASARLRAVERRSA